jgi:hypothetical protein
MKFVDQSGNANEARNCPPKIRAASTKPGSPKHLGYVEASPSRAFRDGEGTFSLNRIQFNLIHYKED